MDTDDLFEIHDATALRKSQSGKALLVEAPIFDEPKWVPISQIHDNSEVWDAKEGRDEGTLIVPRWLAENEGWTDE